MEYFTVTQFSDSYTFWSTHKNIYKLSYQYTDIELSLSGQDLLVNFKGNDTDQLVLKDFMLNNTINNFEFADGTVLDKTGFMKCILIYF